MSEEIAKLIVSVEAQTAKFSRDMDVMQRKLDGFAKRQEMAARRGGAAWSKLGAQIKTFAAAYLGAALFRGIIRATAEAEKSFANLQNAVANNGKQAGMTATEMAKLATELQGLSTFDDEAIQDAMALLLRFRDIGNFDNAIRATLDLAAAMKIDLASAAKLVGKIMSDPNTGIASAKKAGVIFSQAQKDMIESMVAAGKKAEAQQYIFEQLQGTTVNAAAAMRDNFGGALEGLKNDFGNLLEVKSGLPGATQAINDFSAALRDPDFKAGIDASLGFMLTLILEIIKGWGLLLGLVPQLVDKLKLLPGPLGTASKIFSAKFGMAFGGIPEPPKPASPTGAGGVSLVPGEPEEDTLLRDFIPTNKELSDAEKAIEKIQGMVAALRDQVATYGASEAGAAAYNVTLGEQAEIFNAAGPAGEALRQEYIRLKVELEDLKVATEAENEAQEKATALKEEVAAALQGLKTDYDLASDAIDKYIGWLELGMITEEQFAALVKQTGDALAEQAKKSSDAAEEMTIQWDQAFRNMQDILADTLFESFEGGVKDMVYQWANALKRMASEALAANIFGLLTGGAGGGGSGFSLGGFLGAIFGGFTGGGAAAGAGGGGGGGGFGASFAASGGVHEGWTMVGERGRELVNFNSPSMVLPHRATEEIMGSANGGARPINVYFDVTTPDADSFMRSRTQIEARMSTALNRASARNN
jgi:hypothetical protein